MYGGLTAASIYRAAAELCADVGADWRLRSMSLQYAAPVAPTTAEVEVEVERRGLASSFASARLRQQGRTQVQAMLVFGRDRPNTLDEDLAAAPEAPAPHTIEPFPYLEGVMPTFTRHVEMRPVRGAPFQGGDTSRITMFLAFREPPAAMDVVHVLGLLDSPPPAVLARAKGVRPASTVSFQLHLLRDPPADVGPWLVDVESTVTSGGWSDEEIRLYGPDRRLVAVGRQLVALIR